jgi:hypothetical protein
MEETYVGTVGKEVFIDTTGTAMYKKDSDFSHLELVARKE